MTAPGRPVASDDGGCAGILLTGGASRRLGYPKALLELEGETLARRAARVLASVCEPCVEVGPGWSGLRAVADPEPDAGPLAALVAGVAALPASGVGRLHRPVVLLAVDLPRVESPLLALLASVPGRGTAVPELGGRLQPVCARYGTDALDAAPAVVAAGERSLRALLAEPAVEVVRVPEARWGEVAPPDAFDDVDTPEDARRLGLSRPGDGAR